MQLLIDRRNAKHRCYDRTKRLVFLNEFLSLCDEVESKTETARAPYLQAHISDDRDLKKNMWKELRHLGLLPGADDALHGSEPDELNAHFVGVSVSSMEIRRMR